MIDSADALCRIRAHWLARVVHDFRGPIFTSRGYVKLLMEERAGNVTATQREYLTNILEAIGKLSSLVDHIHELPSEQSLHLEPVNLGDLLRSVTSEWRSGRETLHLVETIPPGPIMTAADSEKLRSAVHKLLGCAVEFSQSSGEVKVQVRREDEELTVRVTATRHSSSASRPLFDVAIPCEILRLHGGVAHVDGEREDRFVVTIRLPLVTFETSELELRR